MQREGLIGVCTGEQHQVVEALVDYDNVRLGKENSPSDVSFHLDELLDAVVAAVQRESPLVQDIRIRLYGGWITESGAYSRNAQWMLAAIPQMSRRRKGVRLYPKLVTSALCFPAMHLVGTVRMAATPVRQKMVDALMVVDAVFLSSEDAATLYILSDDDDLLPGALQAAHWSAGPVTVLRQRADGTGLNDASASAAGVVIRCLRP